MLRATTIAVVVPTYARPQLLPRCLDALARQRRPPDDVILVVRADDEATAAVADRLTTALPVRLVEVGEAGLVRALNAGLAAAAADIVAFTDDDAAPHDDWLLRIETAFDAADVAAVGGRDIVWEGGRVVGGVTDAAAGRSMTGGTRDLVVGRVQRFGRITANHHLGSGPPRDVDILKGADMAYRRELAAPLGFDPRLRGSGSQVHNEASLCLPLRAAGWRIVYDPAIAVDHHPAPRSGDDVRELLEPGRVYDATFNEALSLWPFLARRWYVPHIIWAVFAGTIWSPGLAQVPRHLLRGNRGSWRLVIAALQARRDALRASRAGPPRVALPAAQASSRGVTDA